MGFFDYDRALKEYAIAAKGMPNSPDVLEGVAYVWRRQGLFEEAKDYLERAMVLDPRQFWLPMQLGLTCALLRQYAEAERFIDRSLALEPRQMSSYIFKSLNALNWTGDLQRARTVLESSPTQADPEIKIALFWQHIFERNYQGALDQLPDLPPAPVYLSLEITPRDMLAGYAHQLMGSSERAQSAYESALTLMEEMVQESPEDGRVHGALGLVYAGLGRKDEAVLEGRKGLELQSNDALQSPLREWELARILLLLGEYDTALDHIKHLLSVSSLISAQFLEIYPGVDPQRNHPRFQQILDTHSEG
jgi:tetratricopeptide (TPR) repeat protein